MTTCFLNLIKKAVSVYLVHQHHFKLKMEKMQLSLDKFKKTIKYSPEKNTYTHTKQKQNLEVTMY